MHWRSGSRLLLGAVLLVSCEDRRLEPQRQPSATEPSPNASIQPAPLATGPELAVKAEYDAGRVLSDAAAHDAGDVPPRSLREDQPLPSDSPSRDASGITLEARFRWLDLAVPPRVPETNGDGLGRARDKTDLDLALEIATVGRMRAILTSPAFAVPEETEIRAAAELFGHVLVWPERRAYTVLSPGMLRAVFGERRTDVTPLVAPKVEKRGSGTVLGFPTQRVSLSSATGKLELEQAELVLAGSGGMLLCRLLVELIAAEPATSVCQADLVPVRAEFAWSGGGRLGFDVARITRKQDFDPASMTLPPEGAEFHRSELLGTVPGLLLAESELADFRTRPAARVDKLPAGAPKEGLVVTNRADIPSYVLVDEVIVAWLRPGAEQVILGLPPGKYQLSARDFFGSEAAAPKIAELPTRYVIGDEAPKSRPHE